MKIAAIDQGTTSTRALIAATDAPPHIVHSVAHRQSFPQNGWVEQDGLELLRNVLACLEAAGAVDAIGIANQGESCLAWDAETGEPVSPVITWQDNRTTEATERLKRDGCETLTRERAGLPLDPYFSASKLAWIVANIPHARKLLSRGRLRLGTTDAFFLDRLCGRYITDATTASRTSLMNLATGEWDAELCRLFGVPIEALPPIGPTAGAVLGSFGALPVTAAVVDQQAALYGHGCRKSGDAKITFGTGAFALAVTGAEIVTAPELGLLPTIAWRTPEETIYAVDGGLYDAGSVIEWLHRLELFDSHDELTRFDSAAAIARDLVFVPALAGLACPYWDRSASGLWIGLTAATTKADLCQSALEGIALLTGDVMAALRGRMEMRGAVSIDGGLTQSRYFTQFLADALGCAVRRQAFSELTAYGCAGLAAMTLERDLCPPVETAEIMMPRTIEMASWRSRFAEALRRARNWRQS